MNANGEWRVLLLALVIGVGSVSTTGFLGDRIKRAMSEQGASFLGADLLVTSPRPIEAWPRQTLRTSRALEFASMVTRGDAFQLASLRAVDAAYPLRGVVRIADAAVRDRHAASGAAAAWRGLCRPGTAAAAERAGRRCGADRRSDLHHRRRGDRGTGPDRRRVRPRPARVPARRRSRDAPAYCSPAAGSPTCISSPANPIGSPRSAPR